MTDLIAVALGWAVISAIFWAVGADPILSLVGCLFFPVYWWAVRYGPDKE